MANQQQQGIWARRFGLNLGYIEELYERYLENPDAIDAKWRTWFERWGPPLLTAQGERLSATAVNLPVAETALSMEKVIKAVHLVQNIRTYGHLAAKIDPFHTADEVHIAYLDPHAYGLSEQDLKAVPANLLWSGAPDHLQSGLDVVRHLKKVYTQSIAFQFNHISNIEEREWLSQMVETGLEQMKLTSEEKKRLAQRLIEVEEFEKFLHRTFVGQKRFSIEGLDCLVPMLDELVCLGVEEDMSNILIGMAHRGRLNVLAHVLGKPLELIFAEFHHAPDKSLVPSEGSVGINYGWTGDVKYHLGGDRAIKDKNVITRITLANNPSHLEFVNPVVLGFTRASQEERDQKGFPRQDVTRSFAILIHGDAAFPGEGVVAETLNLSGLKGYWTGGSIHIIANNRLGFTTEEGDARSTKYASDLAQGFEIPVVHVNADDPEACLLAVRLAFLYRKRYHKDFMIDLIGYRRFGHNEADDPVVTQPLMYTRIKKHPTVKEQFTQQLIEEGILSKEEVDQKAKAVIKRLETAYAKVKNIDQHKHPDLEPPKALRGELKEIETKVPREDLRRINHHLLMWPDGFTVYPKLRRILERRAHAFEDGGKVDWAHAEILALATILADGYPIRFTGQDVERGTFAQRHLILHDSQTGERFSPLHYLPEAKASFAIHNSPLTETAVLGYEYGYSVFTEDVINFWEAQFGDFANVAQVIFDQFISSGRAKWGDSSNLIVLLPHGYEGQGPEHSSGRIERFLQMAAENNWFVVNVTQAAQYFHVLRRQALLSGREEERPLIIFTPKSLLRHPKATSPSTDLSEGRFQRVLDQPGTGEHPERVKRLILCSGKIGVDLEEYVEKMDEHPDWLHIIRIEELYPFPEHDLKEKMERYPALHEVVWVQEEPINMGPWFYMESRIRPLIGDLPLRYVGRPERSSPAEGTHLAFQEEQERIIKEACTPV